MTTLTSRPDFSFDQRVAGRYDVQRAHPSEVSRQIGEAIAAQVGAGASVVSSGALPVLEIGVGTGRIAWPVVDAGCRVVGIDLSAEMLGEVYAQRDRHPHLTVLQGDMHSLPLPSNHFAGALAVHVLHLARDWQQVLREVTRTLKPGAVFVQGDDWIDPQSVVGLLRNQLRMFAAKHAPNLRPPAATVSKEQYLRELGGDDTHEVIAAEWVSHISPGEWLAVVAQRIDAESWVLPPPVFEAVFADLQQFAAERWADLDAQQPVTRRFVLKVTRGDW